MNGIKERMAKGNLDRCVQEIKDVHEYLSKQVKAGEIPSEDDIMQYQELITDSLSRIDKSAAVLREAEAERRAAEEAQDELDAEEPEEVENSYSY